MSESATPIGWQKALNTAQARGGGSIVLRPNGGAGFELTEPLQVTANVPLHIMADGVVLRPPLGVVDGCALKIETGIVGSEAERCRISGLSIRRYDYAGQPGGDGVWIRNSNGVELDRLRVRGGNRAVRVTSDGPGMHAESHLVRRLFATSSMYGVWLESLNGATVSFDQTWFELCDLSACQTSAVRWGQNVRMDRGGFEKCQVWPFGANQRCVDIFGDLTQSTLDFAFDAGAGVTNPTALYFEATAKNLARVEEARMKFYGVWTKVRRDPGIGIAEIGFKWQEGQSWLTEGVTP